MFSINIFILPIILSVGHILTFKQNLLTKKYADILKSFAAGFSVGYVILLLLPEVYARHSNTLYSPAVLVLGSFVLFHVTHKFVFKNHQSNGRIFLLDEIHLLIAGLYNFLIAFSTVELVKVNPFNGTIIGVLLVLHALLIDITNTEMTKHTPSNVKLFITLIATLAGGIIGIYELSNEVITTFIFSITAGAMIYISIREEIPHEKVGRPLFFILGSLILMVTVTVLY